MPQAVGHRDAPPPTATVLALMVTHSLSPLHVCGCCCCCWCPSRTLLQCEQTKGNVGCDQVGICGKTPGVALMQDLLIFQLKVRPGQVHSVAAVFVGPAPRCPLSTRTLQDSQRCVLS
jgi:hypothetical protein